MHCCETDSLFYAHTNNCFSDNVCKLSIYLSGIP